MWSITHAVLPPTNIINSPPSLRILMVRHVNYSTVLMFGGKVQYFCPSFSKEYFCVRLDSILLWYYVISCANRTCTPWPTQFVTFLRTQPLRFSSFFFTCTLYAHLFPLFLSLSSPFSPRHLKALPIQWKDKQLTELSERVLTAITRCGGIHTEEWLPVLPLWDGEEVRRRINWERERVRVFVCVCEKN